MHRGCDCGDGPGTAAKLVDVLADEKSARETCPVVPVAISGGGAGDQTVESPEVQVLVGKAKAESAPTGGQTNRQVVARANRSKAPKSSPPRESEGGGSWKCRDLSQGSIGQRRRRRNWVYAADGHPGVPEGDRSIKNDQRKLGTTRRSPRPQKGHSEGSAYKSLCDEVVLRWRVGRMGPTK
jgi:hypothetical protein